MLLRFFSTIVLAPIAIAAIWFGWPYFDALVAMVALIGLTEWIRVSRNGHAGQAAQIGWLAIGVLYIGVSCLCMVFLRSDPVQGRGLALAFFAVVWATDIGAYLVGRTLGGPKLAPGISPNKTWSGAVGGLACGVVCGFVVARLMDLSYADMALVGVGAAISVVSQIGDLIESWWKRYFGVKDSGSLIPGHGGILDRIDGVLLASPVAMAGHWVAQGGGPLWK
jgi:phosphatidate cytidylyltransferase